MSEDTPPPLRWWVSLWYTRVDQRKKLVRCTGLVPSPEWAVLAHQMGMVDRQLHPACHRYATRDHLGHWRIAIIVGPTATAAEADALSQAMAEATSGVQGADQVDAYYDAVVGVAQQPQFRGCRCYTARAPISAADEYSLLAAVHSELAEAYAQVYERACSQHAVSTGTM
jgi:hypothetical protein